MRKVQLLLVCLMLSAAAFAADKVIKLPKPNLNRTGTVMKALSERHSTREYASKSLSLSDLSDLLWAANGINLSLIHIFLSLKRQLCRRNKKRMQRATAQIG